MATSFLNKLRILLYFIQVENVRKPKITVYKKNIVIHRTLPFIIHSHFIYQFCSRCFDLVLFFVFTMSQTNLVMVLRDHSLAHKINQNCVSNFMGKHAKFTLL